MVPGLKKDGYMPIAYFEAPMPDPTDKAADYAPPDDNTGGEDVLATYGEKIKPYITKDNFQWVNGVKEDKFDLDEIEWTKLSVAHGRAGLR